jgi:L-histidine Nalpha-methyltransferase
MNTADHEMLKAAEAALSRPQKTLPCRFFYDARGSFLFEQICEQPEYYLTRTEDAILRENADSIAAALAPDLDVVELGSGSSRKTRRLLEAILRRRETLRYIPVDISSEMLDATSRRLRGEYPRLEVAPIAAEYFMALERLAEQKRPVLVLFLGSNLGNFTREEAGAFLGRVTGLLTPESRLLVGLDLQKDPLVLEAAYNDRAGVTAEFNLNLLRRLNVEVQSDFALDGFTHRAVFNPDESRIEMHLVSERHQTVRMNGSRITFEPGETIHTENSYKYSREQIRELVEEAGLRVERVWTDSRQWFSVNLLAPECAACETR